MKREFDDLYNELVQNPNFKITNHNIKFIIAFALLVCITVIIIKKFSQYMDSLGIILLVLYIGIFLGFVFFQDIYIKNYKNKILSGIVELYDSNLKFQTKFDIGIQNYKKSNLPQKFDKFTSRDGIIGTINGNSYLRMAYITTKRKEIKNVDGKIEKDWITNFFGIFGYAVTNKNINTNVEIRSNDFKQNFNKKRIELESSEFEKEFDCFADNKIVALQILTPEVIDKINVLHNSLNVPIEITIQNEIIYYRLLINDYFYPPRFGNPVDKNRLKKVYDIIDFSYELIDTISNSMMEI